MTFPFFYIKSYDSKQEQIVLDEDNSRHIVQVLRMKQGEQLNLTDGKGSLLTCTIADDHKKHCTVTIDKTEFSEQAGKYITIAISLVKNTNRFEWFLEKATEIGVREIIPLICERTEKERFRLDRMQGICISAMLQSQQAWLPVLHEPVTFEKIGEWKSPGLNLIAHCIEQDKKQLKEIPAGRSLICIGPEGDFTSAEIGLALQENFVPVGLGETRLRTETAGVVAAALLLNS